MQVNPHVALGVVVRILGRAGQAQQGRNRLQARLRVEVLARFWNQALQLLNVHFVVLLQ